MYFHFFVIVSPWKRVEPFILKKIESPSPKDALCQVWLKLAQWFCRRRWKCKKFTTTNTTITKTMENWQILFRKDLLSLQLRWAKKVARYYFYVLCIIQPSAFSLYQKLGRHLKKIQIKGISMKPTKSHTHTFTSWDYSSFHCTNKKQMN